MAHVTKFIAWPDLSKYKMRMVITTLPSGQRSLVMIGGDQYAEAVQSLGFSKINGHWMRKDMNVVISDFVRDVIKKFPKAYRVDLPRNEIMRIVRLSSAPTDEEIQTNIDLSMVMPLGLNYLGYEVYEGAEGRFVRDYKGNPESEKLPGFLLRAETEDDLDLCADGLIKGILKGRIFRTEDIDLLGKNIFGHDVLPNTEVYTRFHTSIGRALSRALIDNTSTIDRSAYLTAIKLHEGLPPVSGAHAERIVTMPMGIVAQLLVGSADAKNILIPSVGNGAFTSAVRDGSVFFSNLTGYTRHDATMANLPYGELNEPADYAGTIVNRSDHLEVMRMLDSRTTKGKSVFFFQANTREPDEDTKKMIGWIAARFNIEGMAHLDSHMFGRGGTQYGRFMLVVGNRGAKIFNAEEKIESIFDYEKLWEWSHSLVIGLEGAAKELAKLREESSLQSPYVPFSQVSEPKAMVPRNLVGPLNAALSRLTAMVGDIDAWVAKELDYELDDLSSYLDSEQVDAVALSIAAHKAGRGFIEADQTGLGKGRVLAAMVRWGILNGLPVIFVTKEAKLFSDFFRDLRDIGTDGMVKHITVNSGVPIELEGVTLHKSSSKKDITEMIDSESFPDDKNLVMATYSQFNREYDKHSDAIGSKKAKWIAEASRDALLILDESHIAAGSSSNTGFNIQRAVSNSASVTYSSATYAKNAKNFGVYSKVLPNKLLNMDISMVLDVGGDALREVFSADLASEGVLIRREHDMSDLQILTSIDNDRIARNEMMADKMANILEGIGLIAGEVETFVNEKNRLIKAAKVNNIKSGAGAKKNKHAWRGINFGAKMYMVQRQFLLALSVDKAADDAIKALKEGRKPIIGIENTMEAMIRDALTRQIEIDNDSDFDEDEDPSIELDEENTPEASEEVLDESLLTLDVFADGRELETNITFREVLRKFLERSVYVKETNNEMSTEQVLENENIRKYIASVNLLIDAFPDLPVSPIDQLRKRIEDEGYSFGEYSSRSIGLETDDSGNQKVRKISKENKNRLLDNFNNGITDVLLLTTSGSTGISAHASATFRDQRQREFIELQIANDVATRMQFHGRANRKGQVCSPIINTLSLGIPAENRLLSMQNNKLRALSANTTSNQDNNNIVDSAPDILNPIGNMIAREYLIEDQDLMKRIAFNKEKLDDEYAKAAGPSYYIETLTARLSMLPTADQRRVYEELNLLYEQKYKELDDAGINPLKTKVLEWNAKKIGSAVVIPGNPHSESVFDRDVTLTTIEYAERIKPVTRHDLIEMVSESKKRLKENDPRYKNVQLDNNWSFYGAMSSVIERSRKSVLQTFLPAAYKDVTEALSGPAGKNIVKTQNRRMDMIISYLRWTVPGNVMHWRDMNGFHIGMITDFRVPKEGQERLPSKYTFTVKVPGEVDKEFNYFQLSQMEEDSFGFEDTSYNKSRLNELYDRFEKITDSTVKETRHLLDGNLFLAAQRALLEKMGTSVIYTDENGERHRGILLPKDVHVPALIDNDGSSRNYYVKEIAAYNALQHDDIHYLNSNAYQSKRVAFEISRDRDDYSYKVKMIADSYFANTIANDTSIADMLNITEKNKRSVTGKVYEEDIQEFLSGLYKNNLHLYVPGEKMNIIQGIESQYLHAEMLAKMNKNGMAGAA